MTFLLRRSTQLAALLIAVASLAVGRQGANAEDPAAVRQLLQTNRCENCDLSGVNLRRLNLTGANLQGANLQGAQLNFTNLSQADLSGANLQGAEISRAIFQGANLQEAILTNAKVDNLCLTEAVGFHSAECAIHTLIQTLGSEVCTEAYGIQAEIAHASDLINELCVDNSEINSLAFYLYSAHWNTLMLGISMMGADLRGADLSGVNLTGADLRYAQLARANLQDTDLSYGLLFNAELDDVRNANFDQAFLTKADVGPILGHLFEQQALAARSYEGEAFMGAMNRAQVAFYVEKGQFAAQLNELDVDVPSETDAYRYEISQVTETFVVHQAISLQETFNSYLSLVYVTSTPEAGSMLEMLLCESVNVGTALSDPIAFEPPTSDGAEVSCPAGWRTIP